MGLISKIGFVCSVMNLNRSIDHHVQNFFLLSSFLTAFIFLSASCLSLQLDVARYACVTNTVNLFDHITKSV